MRTVGLIEEPKKEIKKKVEEVKETKVEENEEPKKETSKLKK